MSPSSHPSHHDTAVDESHSSSKVIEEEQQEQPNKPRTNRDRSITNIFMEILQDLALTPSQQQGMS